MSRSRYRILEPQLPHFFTCTIVAWLPVFTRPETMEIVLDSWRFLQKERSFTLHGFVILDNHLHMIAHSPDLGKDIGDFKSFTANQIIKLPEGSKCRDHFAPAALFQAHAQEGSRLSTLAGGLASASDPER
jgi:hypothetical protein